MKRHKSFLGTLAVVLALALTVGLAATVSAATIRFADLGWGSAQVNNRIARFIIENGYGHETEFTPGESIPLLTGVVRGDLDVDIEVWVENQQEAYDKAIADGDVIDLGANFPDSWQGWLVPTYVIKGDPERGIEPMAPDLKSVMDMPKYAKLFKDAEDPSKGRFYSCIPGWECEKINEKKFETYGLNKTYNIFLPGSNAALAGSMASAVQKGEPWFGYYWAPTWVLGKLDMTPLEEPPFDQEVWDKNKGCAYPSVKVNIVVNKDLPKKAPEVVEFFKKWETTVALQNKILAYMQDTQASTDDAAIWFLKNYKDLWTQWVPDDVKAKVLAALEKK